MRTSLSFRYGDESEAGGVRRGGARDVSLPAVGWHALIRLLALGNLAGTFARAVEGERDGREQQRGADGERFSTREEEKRRLVLRGWGAGPGLLEGEPACVPGG